MNGKLLFALCRTCAETQPNEFCTHTDDERQLTGTWCTPEIEKALELGYELRKIHEVWHYEQSEIGLFAEYINTFLKFKTEASGPPKENMTDQELDEFIELFYQHEGVRLEKEKIALNPGLRALAKLCLNSKECKCSYMFRLTTRLRRFLGKVRHATKHDQNGICHPSSSLP